MEWLLIYAPAFACVAMMLVICVPMMRRMMAGGSCNDSGASREEVAELRAEVARLRGERSPVAPHDEVTHV